MSYSSLSFKQGRIRGIARNKERYEPRSEAKVLSVSNAATTFSESIATDVKEKSDLLNLMLRKLVSLFLYDFYTHILSRKLFSKLDQKWDLEESFVGDKNHLPARFCDLDGVLDGAMEELEMEEESILFHKIGVSQTYSVTPFSRNDLESPRPTSQGKRPE